jgi:predicted RNA-binding Zn ribbon-like protein
MNPDEDLLLDVLNSAPVVDGARAELLTGDAGAEFARRHGGDGTDAEVLALRTARDALQAVIRGRTEAERDIRSLLDGVRMLPQVDARGVTWHLDAPPPSLLAARTVQAWSDVSIRLPGRLKACANDECNLFLLDRTRPGTAKWCSMATCGNRMKARSYAQRHRNPVG